jgi:hypothetical protein
MMKRTSAVARPLAIVIMVVSLIVIAAGPASAQRQPPQTMKAQQVRELVLKQREKVLAQIAVIMSGQKAAPEKRQIEPAPPEEAQAAESESTAESGEPDGGESDGGESVGGEGDEGGADDEDGDGEAVGVQELPETGVGSAHGANKWSLAFLAGLGGMATVGLGLRRRVKERVSVGASMRHSGRHAATHGEMDPGG